MLKVSNFIGKISKFDDIKEASTVQNQILIATIQEAKRQATRILNCGFEAFLPTIKSQVFEPERHRYRI